MNTEPELLNERLERLATVLDEIMPRCALLVRDALTLLKEKEAVKPVKQIEQAEWTVCSNCRNHIISKWAFCPYCGRPVKWE